MRDAFDFGTRAPVTPRPTSRANRRKGQSLENRETQPYVIEGDRVALGPIERDSMPLFYRWFNDPEMMRTAGIGDGPWTLERVEAWTKRFGGDSSEAWFMVYLRDTGQPIGFAGLRDIDERHGTAEYAISIGEASARGKGYGTEATRLMLDYAFIARGLHSVLLDAAEYNPGGIRAYQKAGFREIGRRHESDVMGGKRWDTVFMQALASEFESPLLGQIFVPDQPRERDSR
jgi:diamine N-acetyltransferase